MSYITLFGWTCMKMLIFTCSYMHENSYYHSTPTAFDFPQRLYFLFSNLIFNQKHLEKHVFILYSCIRFLYCITLVIIHATISIMALENFVERKLLVRRRMKKPKWGMLLTRKESLCFAKNLDNFNFTIFLICFTYINHFINFTPYNES